MATKPNQQKGAKQPAPPAQPSSANAPVDPTGQGIDSQDPIIAKVQDAVRNSIPPQFRVAVQRIVLAGMKVMFSQQTHPLMLNALQSDSDPAHAVGMGVTQLITILFREAKGQMPLPAIIPAAILLCCEALDFMEKAKLAQVTPEVVGNAVQTATGYLMQKLGLTPQKFSQIAHRSAQGQPGVAPIQDESPIQAAAAQGGAPQAQPTPQAAPSPPGGGLVQQQMGA